MTTSTEQIRDTSVLHLSGRMTAGRCDERLPERAQRLMNGGARRLVLDLQNVSYMDSTCLGEIIEVGLALKERGGQLQLINVPSRVQYLLDISKVTEVLSDGHGPATHRSAPAPSA